MASFGRHLKYSMLCISCPQIGVRNGAPGGKRENSPRGRRLSRALARIALFTIHEKKIAEVIGAHMVNIYFTTKNGNGGERKLAMKPKGEWAETIDLSSLYALFSHLRPCDGTLEKSFILYTCIHGHMYCMHSLWNNKWHIPCKSITWSRRELACGWGSPSSKYEHRRAS